jgi:hypothetical protein
LSTLPVVCPFAPALFPVIPFAGPLLPLFVLLLLLLLLLPESVIDAGGRGRCSGAEGGRGAEGREVGGFVVEFPFVLTSFLDLSVCPFSDLTGLVLMVDKPEEDGDGNGDDVFGGGELEGGEDIIVVLLSVCTIMGWSLLSSELMMLLLLLLVSSWS